MKILHRETGAILFEYETRSMKVCVKAAIEAQADLRSADLRSANLSCADLSSANLRSADLRSANLRSADLRSANLSSADLSCADLSCADLRSADLRSANLSCADLSSADLRSANLSCADLSSADLSCADLDFSSGIAFRCSSFGFKADLRLAAQLAYHFCRIDFGNCQDAKAAQIAIKDLANKFHRVEECGKIT